MNEHASALGRLARGHKKTLSQEERKARAERMAEARKKRWPAGRDDVGLSRRNDSAK